MRKDVFYRFGEFIFKHRWLAILCWLFLFLSCIPLAPKLVEPFKAIGFTDPHSQSAQADDTLARLGFSNKQFIILYESDKLVATDPEFSKEIKDSLAGLNKFSVNHQISYPNATNKQISTDKHTAFAVVSFQGGQEVNEKILDEFKGLIKQPHQLHMSMGGEPIFLEDTKIQTQRDLFNAEYIATPVAIITMLVVFGSVIAACLPVFLGGVCAMVILLLLYVAGIMFPLSIFTLNIALLLGLCLSLDYAILIINRYRDELKKGHSVVTAIAVTQATAGKSVFFSGMAVFVSLSALLFFHINVLFSVGIGGLAAVSVAVAVALILLPAILAVLNSHINMWPIKILQSKNGTKGFWHWMVTKVVKRPVIYFCSILVFLLVMGYPFLKAQFGFSDFRILPKTMQSRQVFESFKKNFGESKLDPILVLVSTPHEKLFTKPNIAHLYDFADKLMQDPRVERVVSIVSTEPRISKTEYEDLFVGDKANWPKNLVDFLQGNTRDDLTVMTVISKYPSNSQQTKDLVEMLRHSHPAPNMVVDVTGAPVSNMDALKSISGTFPYAFAWILVFTYVVLLVLMRSLVLPLKAILTAMLSLFSSYGVLTLVIQQGFMHSYLNIEPQGILDISLLIIIFCALFGISMDYEVFLLSRIKEYHERTGNTVKSIVEGIERSSKIISSAAIIVILICVSFMSADILIVKAFGLGIAVAVFVDAFFIRTMLVPATMTLLGKWNWYLPKALGKVLPKISFDQEKKSKK